MQLRTTPAEIECKEKIRDRKRPITLRDFTFLEARLK
jgi:hypothetical protein